ncbi:hypothetical protein DFP93_105156 [Aneurinibacillus soli]|uniref:Uncharacterized protein n=1 Tax=Aneurinibacillus soli TaxID=1500254 RepID=A0A0U5B1Z9_9BACL|nr:hypothetical protein [Aneurinibacillus soli]PYE62202.1 hypothetical protein DFP93_105156 [Aneurinibacillus soli]BAU28610.1 hypothetical protein CB4_02785 [Aneurinibacillus soli]
MMATLLDSIQSFFSVWHTVRGAGLTAHHGQLRLAEVRQPENLELASYYRDCTFHHSPDGFDTSPFFFPPRDRQ